MSTQVINTLLQQLHEALRRRNIAFITQVLPISGDALSNPPYTDLTQEIQGGFPKLGSDPQDRKLERHCEKLLPTDDDWQSDSQFGTSWPAFVNLVKEYFIYLRDRDPDLVELHEYMVTVMGHCITALSHPSLGVLVLKLCLEYAQTLKTLSLMFEKSREDSIQIFNKRLKLKQEKIRAYPVMQRPAERVAETLQKALNICLNDRSGRGAGPASRFAEPQGKKVAVYQFANIIAKCMTSCGKLSGLTTLFTNVQQLGPQLKYYPASQRVTYLYHLGRYQSRFENIFRAVQCFEAAYAQCPRQCVKQRRQILRFLIADSILLGRFPSRNLLMRAEAEGLDRVFLPVCYAVRQGNFHSLGEVIGRTSLDTQQSESAGQAQYCQTWLRKYGLLYKFQSHLMIHTWRCLIRKLFILVGNQGDGRRPPTLDFDSIRIAIQCLDSSLLWPEGERPWYQDIHDRSQYYHQKRQEWEASVIENWEEDPNSTAERWEWEPDSDHFPSRLKRKLPPSQKQPEDKRSPLNAKQFEQWEREEDQRQRTLYRYLRKLQAYRQTQGKKPDHSADQQWKESHALPKDGSETEFVRWWLTYVDGDLFEKTQQVSFQDQDPDSSMTEADSEVKALFKDVGDQDWVDMHTTSRHPPQDAPKSQSKKKSHESIFVQDNDDEDDTTATSISDSDSPSITSSNSFDSDAAAEAAWTGGTFLLSRPQPYPEAIPHRDYPPNPPRTPPPPIDTDALIVNELSNLIAHRLLNGFVSWQTRKFGIEGAKKIGPVEAGFPRVWDVLSQRAREGNAREGVKPGWVPGWVREEYEPVMNTGGVVRLGGARAAGT